LGRRGRELKPGFHLIWPAFVTTVKYYDTTDESTELEPTDLVTKDGEPVKVAGVFRYKIRGDRAWDYITTLGDDSTAVTDFLSMAMAEVVESTPAEQLFNSEGDTEVKVEAEARKQLNRYGFKIIDFYWNYKTRPSRVIRVLTD
jgi:regulator of protease activity HflC (stomatin/prohibitin superfamily)